MKLDDINSKEVPVDDKAMAFIDSCTHFVVFTEDKDGGEYFYHAVGFQKKPDEQNIKSVCEEVRNDPEFGIGDKMDDLNVSVMSGDGAEEVKTFLRSSRESE